MPAKSMFVPSTKRNFDESNIAQKESGYNNMQD